jgi:hypothetical protein
VRRRGDGLRHIEGEIAAEKASALGRAGERLEAALSTLAAIARAFDEAADERRRAHLRASYRAAREQARTARLHLLIHREAVGLRSHRAVDQQFPDPPVPPWL